MRTCRLWSLMWAQICLTASAREDSEAPRKLPRAGEIGIGFIIPRLLLGILGLVESAAALALALVLAFGFGSAAVAAFEAETAAPAVELEDLAGAMRALHPLKTLNTLEDDIVLSLSLSHTSHSNTIFCSLLSLSLFDLCALIFRRPTSAYFQTLPLPLSSY